MSTDEQPEKDQEEREERVQTDEEGHLAKIEVNGKEHKVVNSCTMMEILVHKLEDGREISQVIAHEFMMADHKEYMVKMLTDAITTVMRAKKRSSLISTVGQGIINRIKRERNKKKGGAFGGSKDKKIIT